MSYIIGLLGSGTMGTSIAQLLALKSDQDISKIHVYAKENRLEGLKSKIGLFLDKQIKRKKADGNLIGLFEDKFVFTSDLESLGVSDIVIEAITESLDTKKMIVTELSQYLEGDSVIASNTSSLSITEISASHSKPENVIGLHFFNPATVMELNEVITGLTTSQETLDKTIKFSKFLGKVPVVVNESPGFVVNRMLIPMINEAITVLAEGVASAEDIDKAMKLGANHPMGPLSLADFIGNDVNLSIMTTLFKETGDPKYRPHPLLRKMVRANHLGRKTKKGFFEY